MKNRWIPLETYSFPASTERNLKFQRKWLVEYPWLSYSESEDVAFCLFCCLFGSKEVGKGGHAIVSALVIVPFKRWKNAKDQFKYHQGLQYHKNAVISSQHFMAVFENKIVDISLQLDSDKKDEITKNRKILSSINNRNNNSNWAARYCFARAS